MIHFISDLHLSPQAPGVTRIFLDYLGGSARSAEQLFILGDLFEVWPGDDAIDDAFGLPHGLTNLHLHGAMLERYQALLDAERGASPLGLGAAGE